MKPTKSEHNTDWFHRARWGVLSHYLAEPELSAEEWNRRVDSFDVEGLARQLDAVGAPYFFLTIGQNSGHYCSPNATYDDLVGIAPSKCSRRDLVADLGAALERRGIRLLVYLPSAAPENDVVAVEKLQWRKGEFRLADFQRHWEAVIREWSVRWGTSVAGWWLDGCYYADAMYRHDEPPNFASFAAALKAGNPRGIVAFNPGTLAITKIVVAHTRHEDYTAGEADFALPAPALWWSGKPVHDQRWVASPDGGQAQFHVLSFLGSHWNAAPPRFADEFVRAYTQLINDADGVMTWDVPIAPDGLLPQPFLRQLATLPAP